VFRQRTVSMKHSQNNQEETISWVEVTKWFEDAEDKMTRLNYIKHYDIAIYSLQIEE
jgi:hypothetical protein